jgi:hypothetical protein
VTRAATTIRAAELEELDKFYEEGQIVELTVVIWWRPSPTASTAPSKTSLTSVCNGSGRYGSTATNVTLVPWTRTHPNRRMIAWLKRTGTRGDTGDYSYLHLRLRRDCLLKCHRPSGQFPVAPAHSILREMPQAPSGRRPPGRSPLLLRELLRQSRRLAGAFSKPPEEQLATGPAALRQSAFLRIIRAAQIVLWSRIQAGLAGTRPGNSRGGELPGQRAYPTGSIAAATADARVDDPAGGNCRASGDAAAGEGPAAAVHCGAARYSCYRVPLRRPRHAASGHRPGIPD